MSYHCTLELTLLLSAFRPSLEVRAQVDPKSIARSFRTIDSGSNLEYHKIVVCAGGTVELKRFPMYAAALLLIVEGQGRGVGPRRRTSGLDTHACQIEILLCVITAHRREAHAALSCPPGLPQQLIGCSSRADVLVRAETHPNTVVRPLVWAGVIQEGEKH